GASNASSMPGGVSWQWQKSSVLAGPYSDIAGAVSPTLSNVRSSGYYKLSVSLSSCSNSDTIQIISDLPTPSDACIATSGTANLSVTDPGLSGSNYNWYASPVGGSPLAGGVATTSFTTPVISSTTTYYVQDMSTVSGTVGPATLFGQGQQWGCSDQHLLNFTASSNFNLLAFKVPYETYAISGATVTIEILDNSNTVKATYTSDATMTSGGSGGVASLLRFTFNGGAGVLIDKDSWGSNLKMRMKLNTCAGGNPHWNDAGVSGYPFNYPAVSPVVSIVGSQRSNGSLNTSDYMYFYAWEISTGATCARLPVVAKVGSCSATAINHQGLYKEAIEVSPNPFQHQTKISIQGISKEKLDVYILNLTGNQVMHVENAEPDEILVGENLPAGMYFIRIIQNGEEYHGKMLKN
ncbi:MAG: T9SS type A sorting domain-containing protein, partial [Cytophagaceae bacterium]